MKNKLTVLAGALALAFATAPVAHADIKIGYVDMNKIFNAYYKTQQAKKQIEEAQTTAQKELQDRVDLFNKNVEAIKKLDEDYNKSELSKEAKAKALRDRNLKAEELKSQEKEVVELKNRRLKELQEQALRMRGKLVDEIRQLINDKVKAEQFDLVLDRSGLSTNGVNVVLFSKDSADFSDDIIKALNAGRPKESTDNPVSH